MMKALVRMALCSNTIVLFNCCQHPISLEHSKLPYARSNKGAHATLLDLILDLIVVNFFIVLPIHFLTAIVALILAQNLQSGTLG